MGSLTRQVIKKKKGLSMLEGKLKVEPHTSPRRGPMYRAGQVQCRESMRAYSRSLGTWHWQVASTRLSGGRHRQPRRQRPFDFPENKKGGGRSPACFILRQSTARPHLHCPRGPDDIDRSLHLILTVQTKEKKFNARLVIHLKNFHPSN